MRADVADFSIVVLDDNEVVPIARSYLPQQDNLRVSPYGMHLGNRLPAHATSTGKVLLAALPEEAQHAWVKLRFKTLNAFTIVDESKFLKCLRVFRYRIIVFLKKNMNLV